MAKIRDRQRAMPIRVTPEPTSILQRMPEGKVRIDPSVIGDLACFILTASMRWYNEANQDIRRFEGDQLAAAIERRKYARHCLSAIHQLCGRLSEKVKAVDLETIRTSLQNGLSVDMESPDDAYVVPAELTL